MTRPTPARIVGPVEVPWQHLLYAVAQHAERAPVGELAEHDADRLMQTARIIQARLREEGKREDRHHRPGRAPLHRHQVQSCEAEGYWACWDVILANELPSAHCELVVLRKGIAPTGRAK